MYFRFNIDLYLRIRGIDGNVGNPRGTEGNYVGKEFFIISLILK
jgi:hypothetical protein